ncbi:Peptidase C19 ubiquitin carboxyl-terminal hydrolase 2 [Lasiodiplodia theobromae]|uniref:Peptidase C19 ubiquitin carboxyl-terminal hydrolase 2 n=1 Tax=Lasiodiplodia theobromae TaxID=45133 RepID=UPI0015C33841|nr:Peptidase C19 ubiquitin carboxyl-terminal hydrolase 2 [Lasiodiplodia theobromae]KAF4538376.1 Peptidase C19 ubiquitin carboxyl-terminal hydrolase 2 [Lasiodiplodia theobromae]
MSSFFGRLRSNAPPASPSTAVAPTKKDPNAPQPTPLEKLLAADTSPIRADGSDKFFGFENFGSTCYCNSIIQCLYYSTPFREQVINFPIRSPQDSLADRTTNGLPRINTDLSNAGANGQQNPLSPTRQPSSAQLASPKKSGAGPGVPGVPPGTKPEENKDSPEYKKKQAMAAGPVLNMDYENSKAYGMPESLFTSLKDIFEAIIAHRSRVGVVSPQKFLEILRRENEMFRSAMHQDAHEFLNLLLNEVVENVEQFSRQQQQQQIEQESAEHSGESDSGLAVAMSPVLSNAVKNGATSNVGWVHSLFEDEAFLDLSVDLEQNSSVTSCLKRFSEEEMLCERNKFHCDNCGGLQEAEKRMKVKRLPRILALHLKRFKYTEDMQRLQKLFHRVVYPYYLRLFNTTDDAEDPDRLYELYAVVVHIGGGAYHGHYVSIIKTEDRGWLLFDDEMVEPVDKSYVRNFFGGENVLACAYVLFYQETTEEAMKKEQESEAISPVGDTVSVPLESVSTPIKTEDALSPPIRPASQPPLEHAATFGDRVREEKERRASIKAQEKEAEKLAKAQRKEEESRLKEARAKRQDFYKKQEDEMRQVMALSRATAKEEAKNRRSSSAQPSSSPDPPNVTNGGVHKDESEHAPPNTASTTAPSSTGSEPPAGKVPKENGHHGRHIHGSKSISGGLNRFRNSSISLRHKPKFFSGSGKDFSFEEAPPTPTLPPQYQNNEPHTPKQETPVAPTFASPKWNPETPDRNAESSDVGEKELPSIPPEKSAKEVKKEKRGYPKFGLGKKKSSMLGFG